MILTVKTVAKSLAAYLAPLLPGVTFYEDPDQQGTEPPCMFLQQRSSSLKLQTGGYWLRTLKLDLTYLEDFNLPNMQQLYQTAAEALDIGMETFPYTDDTQSQTALLRTYERTWQIDLNELHYKFELRERVSLPAEAEYEKMQEMEFDERIKDDGN